MDDSANRRSGGNQRDGHLTAREREVLELVGDRLDEEGIARCLGIGRSTVAALLLSSMAKLDARTRTEAVARLASIED